MKAVLVKPEEYLYLQADGIDINACTIDYRAISVCCEDLSLYRKAFRVKIRALIKKGDKMELKQYVNQFYTLAQFVRYLYGFHSCSCTVENWQEDLARSLQKKFIDTKTFSYTQDAWINYESSEAYKRSFKKQYADLKPGSSMELLHCVQDTKPFLNPKDRAHFDKIF